MYIVESDELDIKKIAESGQIFRFNEVEKGLFNLIAGEKIVDIKQISDNSYEFSCDKKEYDEFWHGYFDMNTDYSLFKKNIPEDDKFLNEAVSYAKGVRILKQDEFEMLISFIISQRKSIPSIKSSIEKLSKLCGKHLGEGKYAFPSAEALSNLEIEELNACSLGYRNEYVSTAAKKVAKGEINLKEWRSLGDEDLRNALMSMRGVGIKVANCVALFGYYRINSFPIDVWIQRIIDTYYDGCFPIERYEGYAGIIQQYIFFYGRSIKAGTDKALNK